MAGGGSQANWGLMRSFRRDTSVKRQQLPKGTVRRIGTFARPYRGKLAVFFGLILVSAMAGAVSPLIVRSLISSGIAQHRINLVIWLAVAIAGLAVLSAGLNLWERWISSRVGEGLIYDM
jgi:ATP-binding cassette subfamily B protein